MDRESDVNTVEDADTAWPTLADLHKCYNVYARTKQRSYARLYFEEHLAKNISNLHKAIHSRSYTLGRSGRFIVTKPKPREVFAASYRDRVINNLVVTELLKVWTPKFSPHSFACLEQKGLHEAFRFVKKKLLYVNRKYRGKKIYALKLDVEAFFPSIHRPTIYKIVMDSLDNTKVEEFAKDPSRLDTLKYLTSTILRHDARLNYYVSTSDKSLLEQIEPHKSWLNREQDRGVPIGDLTSQLCANIVLTQLDHYIARTLCPNVYVRYMDDLLLLDIDETKLKNAIEQVSNWLLTNRHQRLNPSKVILLPFNRRLPFLGYLISNRSKVHTPLLMEMPRKKIWGLVQEAKKLEKQGVPEPELIGGRLRSFPKRFAPSLFVRLSYTKSIRRLCRINSMIGHFKHVSAFKAKKEILDRLKQSPVFDEYCNVRSDYGVIQAFKSSYQRNKKYKPPFDAKNQIKTEKRKKHPRSKKTPAPQIN